MSALKPSLMLSGILCALSTATFLSVSGPAIAQDTAEMIATAEKACIDAAVAKGYDEQLSKVVSAETIDDNTVEVVLNLTRDGQGFARLTCPYSVNDGLAVFDDAGAVFDDAVGTVTEATDAVTKTRFPWWWLLVPIIGLPLLLAIFRGRDTMVARESYTAYTEGIVNTFGRHLNVYETPSQNSSVLRALDDGTHVLLTGRQDDQWVELRDGGWVDVKSLRFTEGTTRRYA